MGFIHQSDGTVTAETRRESVILHYEPPWKRDDAEGYSEGRFHPEFGYEDIPDLIAALERCRDEWDRPEVQAKRGWRPPVALQGGEK